MAIFAGYCQVLAAGPTADGPAEIKLRKEAGAPFPGSGFYLSNSNVSREVLATALVAITTRTHVWCEIPDPDTFYSELTRFVLEP
jgi:hypothetical protein